MFGVLFQIINVMKPLGTWKKNSAPSKLIVLLLIIFVNAPEGALGKL